MVIRKGHTLTLALTIVNLFQGVIHADDFYKEATIIGGYSDKDKWVGKKDMSLKNSIGFEYFRKFSNEYGDFLTFDLQMRMAYDSREDSQDAFGVEIHNAWLEYKLGLGKAVRLGHFDPAFGLEPVLDTHGTLLQTLASKNIGFKKDWGVAYRDLWGDFDYEIAAQLGSGMGINRKDGSFLLTGRISEPQTKATQLGISFLYGRTLQSNQSWTIPAPELVTNESIRKNLKLKMQTSYWSNDWEEKNARDLTLSPVIEYKINSSATIRLGYFHDVYSSSDEDKLILLQFYYFGL